MAKLEVKRLCLAQSIAAGVTFIAPALDLRRDLRVEGVAVQAHGVTPRYKLFMAQGVKSLLHHDSADVFEPTSIADRPQIELEGSVALVESTDLVVGAVPLVLMPYVVFFLAADLSSSVATYDLYAYIRYL